MPFLAPEQADSIFDLLPGQGRPPEPPKPTEIKQGVVDVLASGLRTGGNIVTAGYDRLWEPSLPDANPDYRPWDDILGYEDYWREFIRSSSPEETEVIKSRINTARAASRSIDQAGGWGLAAALAGGALDPVTIASMAIPVAPVLGGATRAQRIYAGIAGTAALDTAAEAALHQQDPTRTLADSGFRVGAGALLTGAFGGLATRVPRAEFERMRKELQGVMREVPDQQSVGAMRAGPNTTLDDVTIDTKAARAIAKTIGRISPLDRILTSSSKAARILAAELAEVPYKLKMNFKGKAITALETSAVQREMSQRYNVNQLLDDAFGTYRQRVGREAMSFEAFKVSAAKALRRNDTSDVPEIASLARSVRKNIFDPDRAELQRFGALPENIDLMGAKSYFPRLWDTAVIARRGDAFRDKLKRHFARNPPDEVLPDGTTKPSKALDDVELKALVEEVVTHIKGTTRGIADIATITVPGALKKRMLNIPEAEFEEFLVNDFEAVMNGYIRAMAPQIEARRAGFSSMHFEDELQKVVDEYEAARSNMKSAAAIKASEEEEERVLRDLRGIILRVTNQVGPKGGDEFQNIIKAARMVRAYNYGTKLGGQTLSSFSDYGHIATRYGAIKTNAALVKFLTNVDFNKMTRADLKRMGVAVDWVLDSRTSTLAEIGDELGSSKLERAVEWGTKKFTRVTGMATWNSVMKALTGALEQDMIVRHVKKMLPEGVRSTRTIRIVDVELPPVPEGHVRIFRGESPSPTDQGKWYTTNRNAAEMYGREHANRSNTPRRISYIDLTAEEAKNFKNGPDSYFLEADVAQRAKSAVATVEDVTEAAIDVSALKPFERAKLAEYGLGDDELRRVAKMVEQHADDSEGMWRLRTDEWDDRGIAQIVEGAISKAANIMVIRKGAGDLPLLMNREAAKTLFQFKSFGMAAVNRILIPVAQGLSHRDAATANGFAMMLALGGMTYAAKEYASGRTPDLSPGQLVKESLNWSGALAYMPDVWDPLTIVTPKSVRDDLRFSKFKDVSAAQTLAGPTFGSVTDTIALIAGVADGEGVSQRDLHSIRKTLVPMQNVFYLRRIIDAMEGEVGEAIDAEGATSDEFVDRITKTETPKQ